MVSITRTDYLLPCSESLVLHARVLCSVVPQVFSRGQDDAHRGLTPGFLEGVMHQRLVRGRAPRHRGVYAGKVVRVVQQGRGTGRQTGGGGATRGRYVDTHTHTHTHSKREGNSRLGLVQHGAGMCEHGPP